jgi:hypothetical protein
MQRIRTALSGPPPGPSPLDEVDDDLRKRYHVQHAIKKANKDAQKPVLWVTSPGRSETVLQAYVGLPAPGWPDGSFVEIHLRASLPGRLARRIAVVFRRPHHNVTRLPEARW